ncbi:MAG: lysophospholipid acyltransferase family protein [Lachnospiraceae bacterium]|jgi:1-acyl-sn-glycerol-3-phosphate acyltransferase|nr:lysophospholipid acyltransferase family protein [Lachnospiraceae bacterium]MEE3460331.1 lysophospholipid acyltransferase family protein [Lachnospiraceae bacterium]
MRTIIIMLCIIIFYVICIILFPAGWLIGLFDKRMKHAYSQTIIRFMFRLILLLGGVRVTVKGRENILTDRSALYTFNHRGFFDIIVGYVTGPDLMLYVAKKELGHVPLISRWMRYMHCLFLDRKDLKKGMQMIKDGIGLLKDGYNVFIAPEGTRSKTSEMGPFHEGSFRLATKSGCPVIPVAINNTDEVFEKHLPWVHKTHVVIEYLPAIYMEDLDKEEMKHLSVRVRNIIDAKVKENSALV